MTQKTFIILASLYLCCVRMGAADIAKSDLQQRAETEENAGNIAAARYNFIRAFEEYADKGKPQQAVACGVKATALYYQRDNLYKEAFEFLHRVEHVIAAARLNAPSSAALQYAVTKERMQMYMKLRKSDNAQNQLSILEKQARIAKDEELSNDLLYTKAIFYYTFGQNEKGNAVFREMATKLTALKEYDKVEDVYKTLIANGRRSNNASMVTQSYQSYIAWKDSVNALKTADEIGALKQQIVEQKSVIAEKDSSLASRGGIITALCILAAILAVVLCIGTVILLRFLFLTRNQKKTIRREKENNALKAKFISNISAQLNPTLQRLDSHIPEVKALQDFSQHIQTLAELEKDITEEVETEEVQIPAFCKNLVEQIRDSVKTNVNVTTDVPNMSTHVNRSYVSHILLHLLGNAAVYTPEGGHITLEYKKRSAHKCQFLISNTGETIPSEKPEEVFKPFVEVRDLTTGDGLGLPICKQMAIKMGGDLEIDHDYTRGTRFVLSLYDGH